MNSPGVSIIGLARIDSISIFQALRGLVWCAVASYGAFNALSLSPPTVAFASGGGSGTQFSTAFANEVGEESPLRVDQAKDIPS
jgi:hypothetical protein